MITSTSLLKLLAAIAVVESNVDDHTVGDGGDAIGRYQIHAKAVEDVNKFYNTDFSWRQMHDPASAEWVALLYLQLYLKAVPNAGLEDAARIWNGGPDGWRQGCTLAYWHKVSEILRYMKLRDAIANTFSA